ncbi:MAG: PorP/SprF family type IX secretion system membrane protein [Bacteroidota bacterium]
MKKFVLSACCCLLLGSGIQAQQLFRFTQYRAYTQIINPAAFDAQYLLLGDEWSIGLSHRRQWVNLPEGAPTHYLLSAHVLSRPRANQRLRYSMGGQAFQSETGPIRQSGIRWNGALRLKLGESLAAGGLSIGCNAGFNHTSIQFRQIRAFHAADPTLFVDQPQWANFDFDVGVFFHRQIDNFRLLGARQGEDDGDVFYLGVSIPQVIENVTEFRQEEGGFTMERVPHLYFQAAYLARINDFSFLEFASWFRYVNGAPLSQDFNLRYNYSWSDQRLALWLRTGIKTSSPRTFYYETGIRFFVAENTINLGWGGEFHSTDLRKEGGTFELNLSISGNR